MIRFDSDYTQGAHPLIIEKLVETNFEQTVGYSQDEYCEHARQLIQEACGTDKIDVHFLVGGTQTNATFIDSVLRTYQGVISADTGHINVHETGSIELGGHKVITVDNIDGKLTAKQVEKVFSSHYSDDTHEHMVEPKMVYISFPTEIGTIYSLDEIKAIYEVCQKYDACFFIDGARLGYGLCAYNNDVSLHDLCKYSDAFYIGGTKVGALFGEALVIVNDKYKHNFRYCMKQHGAMLAKGRLLGIQFETLFTDDLYFRISKNAIDKAQALKNKFIEMGYELFADSDTNQQFVYLSDKQAAYLKTKYGFSLWQNDDDKKSYRFCTSWATTGGQLDSLIEDLEHIKEWD